MKHLVASLVAGAVCIGIPGMPALAQATPPTVAAEGAKARQLQIATRIRPIKGQRAPTSKDLTAYLLAYFKDETHSLHFAVSTDGYIFTDVNDGAPVLAGHDIAKQHGIRDPHIVRGPDGAFYLAMTDLHIFGQKEGLRTTEWERPGEAFGWGNNRSLILMKSNDLIHWTHSLVRVGELFKSANIGAAWAPQTIYDPKKKKMMVYYSTRLGNGPNHMVYSYANEAFTTLTAEPRPLFVYPKAGVGTVDADIAEVGEAYHLFYATDDKPGNLRQAVSSRMDGGYVFNPQKVDPEKVGTEAPNLWRRHGTDTYVLMYDVFKATPHNNMGFSETRDFIHFRDIGRFNDPHSPMKATNFSAPKHGAVIPISLGELERLKRYFARDTEMSGGGN